MEAGHSIPTPKCLQAQGEGQRASLHAGEEGKEEAAVGEA